MHTNGLVFSQFLLLQIWTGFVFFSVQLRFYQLMVILAYPGGQVRKEVCVPAQFFPLFSQTAHKPPEWWNPIISCSCTQLGWNWNWLCIAVLPATARGSSYSPVWRGSRDEAKDYKHVSVSFNSVLLFKVGSIKFYERNWKKARRLDLKGVGWREVAWERLRINWRLVVKWSFFMHCAGRVDDEQKFCVTLGCFVE